MKIDSMSRPGRLAALLFAATGLGLGPCGPIPGGALSGEEGAAAVADWTFVAEVPRCQIEVRPDDPHSITLNCMSWQGRLFVSCSRCEGKTWSGIALEDPRGRIRVGDRVYPVTMTRVDDPAERGEVWRARGAKLGSDASGPPPDAWWTFELRSR